ncbi:class D sortase [Mangrovimicrobium sediminis]|uniref:Class D sortase n=1 Tax=Mangrovimicrobium sediminis TaxID=2562682 RepID=A0A4Z0M2H0_9GAMM|nr:class D sortase [Haliea sp. SAOS-164]TGD73634.1 class D sortase [Haliea sp. SAOS-164]
MNMVVLQFIERILTTSGVIGLLCVAAAWTDGLVHSRAAINSFNAAYAAQADGLAVPPPDQRLWSASRVRDYIPADTADTADANAEDAPLALLEIGRLGMQVPVFAGTDPVTLNRGAGVVGGTAFPGEKGNIAVSAHRDGYFRALKDIRVGDQITLRTLDGEQRFEVASLHVTDPLDVSVLADTGDTVLTLITCYPFYYVGFAPERLIVTATLLDDPGTAIHAPVSVPSSTSTETSAVREITTGQTAETSP